MSVKANGNEEFSTFRTYSGVRTGWNRRAFQIVLTLPEIIVSLESFE